MELSAMELQLGVFGFLPTTHAETNAHKIVHDLQALYDISYIYLDAQPQCIHTWQITIIQNHGKTRILLIWALCWFKDGAGSGISCLYLWNAHISYHRNWVCYTWYCLQMHIICILVMKTQSKSTCLFATDQSILKSEIKTRLAKPIYELSLQLK